MGQIWPEDNTRVKEPSQICCLVYIVFNQIVCNWNLNFSDFRQFSHWLLVYRQNLTLQFWVLLLNKKVATFEKFGFLQSKYWKNIQTNNLSWNLFKIFVQLLAKLSVVMFPSKCQVNFKQTFKMWQKRKCELETFPSTGLKRINWTTQSVVSSQVDVTRGCRLQTGLLNQRV